MSLPSYITGRCPPRLSGLCITFFVMIAGCTSLQPAETAVLRQPLSHFSLEGRIAASDDNQSVHGKIEWTHDIQQNQWTLLTPLGQIVARLEQTPDSVNLMMANGQYYQAANLAALPQGLIGINVPLEQLARWVQAVPSPEAIVRELDSNGRPALVIDQGWRIEYLEYRDASPAALPRRLDVSRGATHLRLVIDLWDTPL